MGIDLVLEAVPGPELQARVKSGNFDVYLFRLLGGRSFDWTYRFWHSPAGDEAALQNIGCSGADAVLERLRRADSVDDTRAAVA